VKHTRDPIVEKFYAAGHDKHSYINTGDDNIAIKAGSTGGSTNITISHNHFYRGHGVSIGSETDGGASAIRVFDLSIEGADNGLRISQDRCVMLRRS
jgi:polygalacturonase